MLETEKVFKISIKAHSTLTCLAANDLFLYLKRESYFLGAQIKTAEVPFKTKDTSFTSVVWDRLKFLWLSDRS